LSNSFQKGWIQEVPRSGWTAFKIYWRERDGEGKLVPRSKTMPRYQPDGKCPTLRKHAEKELARILQPINDGTSAPLGVRGVTFDNLLERHWDPYVEKQKMRPSTRDGYSSMLKIWIKPYFGNMELSKITKDTISGFFQKLRDANKSEQYQKNMYSVLHKMFELAVAYDLIQVSPVNKILHLPQVERGEKQTLPLDKVQTFFSTLPVRWRAPIAVLLLTGMRQGELLGLRWMDIDFDSKLIRKTHVVYRGKLIEGLKQTRRTGKPRKHTVGMAPIVEQILRMHQGVTLFNKPENFVFCREDGRPLDPDHVRRYVLYPAMEAATIPVVKRESGLHLFRHTVVSEVAKRLGLKMAQEQAGHSDIQTTANIYTHVDTDQKLQAAKALQEAFATHLLPSLESSQLTN
jgi:integrase